MRIAMARLLAGAFMLAKVSSQSTTASGDEAPTTDWPMQHCLELYAADDRRTVGKFDCAPVNGGKGIRFKLTEAMNVSAEYDYVVGAIYEFAHVTTGCRVTSQAVTTNCAKRSMFEKILPPIETDLLCSSLTKGSKNDITNYVIVIYDMETTLIDWHDFLKVPSGYTPVACGIISYDNEDRKRFMKRLIHGITVPADVSKSDLLWGSLLKRRIVVAAGAVSIIVLLGLFIKNHFH